MAITLLAATTSATQSDDFAAFEANTLPATFIQNGLAGSEAGDIQISHDGGITFQDLYVNGTKQSLTATNTAITVYGPGIYRVDKDSSSGAAGIFVSCPQSH